MYAFIEGKVADKGPNELVIQAGGVGYLINCSMNTLGCAPAAGETMKVYTHLSVKEDAMELYGFATREEKNMFLRLTSVSGVGPKTALGLLSAMPLKDLSLAIVLGDVTALSRAPGIGKKTAQRIALELKDKVSQEDVDQTAPAGMTVATPEADAATEAMLALQALGYTQMEARSAISKVRGQADHADELIRLALRAMAGM